MTTRLFRVTQRDGLVVIGAVRGAGGLLAGRDAAERMYRASARASMGLPLRDVLEPEPGFVDLLPGYSAERDGDPVRVDLRGARIEVLR